MPHSNPRCCSGKSMRNSRGHVQHCAGFESQIFDSWKYSLWVEPDICFTIGLANRHVCNHLLHSIKKKNFQVPKLPALGIASQKEKERGDTFFFIFYFPVFHIWVLMLYTTPYTRRAIIISEQPRASFLMTLWIIKKKKKFYETKYCLAPPREYTEASLPPFQFFFFFFTLYKNNQEKKREKERLKFLLAWFQHPNEILNYGSVFSASWKVKWLRIVKLTQVRGRAG